MTIAAFLERMCTLLRPVLAGVGIALCATAFCLLFRPRRPVIVQLAGLC